MTNVTVSNCYSGIRLQSGSNDNIISDNTISGAAYSIYLHLSDRNTLSGNTMSRDSGYGGYDGFLLGPASNNTFKGNTISGGFGNGLYIHGDENDGYGASKGNTVYQNNFIGNGYQIYLTNPQYNTGNVFHLAAPDGGNYYNNFDEPGEGCSDGDGDGFCDSPFNFPEGGLDGLPWTTRDGWLDDTPPEIAPAVSGTLGDNDWYVSDVTVSWTVTDPESQVSSTSGCETTVIAVDTAGTTLTCTATSAGGTASESATIKRDATAPSARASASLEPAPTAGTTRT